MAHNPVTGVLREEGSLNIDAQKHGFPGGSDGNALPAVQETWVQSPGWEDPPEKGMATHASILAWRIPWIEEPGGLQSTGLQRVRHTMDTPETQGAT